jgi:hypothetical protein
MTTAEILKFALLAFGAGVTLPLAIQLFLTLRTVHRTVVSTGRRLEQTLDSLEVAAERAERSTSPTARTMTAIGAALIPAIAAGVRAWRGEETHAAGGRSADSRNGDEASAVSSRKETGHARA